MCGIAGFYSVNNSYSEKELHLMTSKLTHRGPDAFGYFLDDVVGLGHRRLSILDISENGNQPMHSYDNRYALVFNGEVYNYREIANEINLIKQSDNKFSFKSSSDTEVVLEAFSLWGIDFVQKLNGMFSIAIYDKIKKELFLFRDRIGIKPLFYYWNGDNLVFASELKSLLSLNIPQEIDKNSIAGYLHLGFVPAPNSIYAGIKKLEAGSLLKISKNGIDFQRYWSIQSAIKNEPLRNEKQAMVMLSDLLTSSVHYQLQSDVPFGVFLSGGIDSSLIAAYAAKLSLVKLNTFSIGFEEHKYNESDYARSVAKYLGSNHHEFIVSFRDALGLLDEIIPTFDGPFGDSSAIPTMLISKLAKNHITVTLSGEGGDELFLGYGAYRWAERMDSIFISRSRHLIKNILLLSNYQKYIRGAQIFDLDNLERIKSHIFSQEQYLFSELELENMLTPDYCKLPVDIDQKDIVYNPYQKNRHKKRELSAKEQQAIFDLKYYLQDDLLTKVDRASMKYSLETRVPFLDHRLIEFSLNLHQDLKIKNGVQKYILKEILYQNIPKIFFNRPKQGFAIPLCQWLSGGFRFLIDDYLNDHIIERYGIVKKEFVQNLKKRFVSGHDYLYNRLWHLILLHKWLDEKKS